MFACPGLIFYTVCSVPWLNGNLALAEKCSGPLRFRLRQVLLYQICTVFQCMVSSVLHEAIIFSKQCWQFTKLHGIMFEKTIIFRCDSVAWYDLCLVFVSVLIRYRCNVFQVLSAATVIAKHTSSLCNACRLASSKTTNPVAKRHFVQSAKDVANSTANLVKEIKGEW